MEFHASPKTLEAFHRAWSTKHGNNLCSARLNPASRSDWQTPLELFTPLHQEFGFTLDACATAGNAQCARYFTPEQDGLSQRWNGVVWCNPPYGAAEIAKWLCKAIQSATEGATVVMLVPADTQRAWWHEFVLPHAAEIRYVRGGVRFVGAKQRAPFPSVVLVFRPIVAELQHRSIHQRVFVSTNNK